MSRPRPPFRPPPGRKLEKFTTCLMPADCPPSVRQLVRTITGALAKWGGHLTAEDKAAACLLVGFGEIARMDKFARDDFLQAMWVAHNELVPANVAANAKANNRIPGAPACEAPGC